MTVSATAIAAHPPTQLLHITLRRDWEVAQATGSYTPASLETEGFIHLSEAAQLIWVAQQFYRAQRGLVLLAIDPARLTAELRYDAVPGHGTFPHLYGPLNLAAVTEVFGFEPDGDGDFALPEALLPDQ